MVALSGEEATKTRVTGDTSRVPVAAGSSQGSPGLWVQHPKELAGKRPIEGGR